MSIEDIVGLISSTYPFESKSKIDEKAQKEFRQFDVKNDYQKVTLEGLKKQRFQFNTKLRSYLSRWASLVVSFWLLLVFIILAFNNTRFCLSDSVLITLLTTTTVNVIGIVAIAMTDLFNGKSEDNMEDID
jgi:hypothetical protein